VQQRREQAPREGEAKASIEDQVPDRLAVPHKDEAHLPGDARGLELGGIDGPAQRRARHLVARQHQVDRTLERQRRLAQQHSRDAAERRRRWRVRPEQAVDLLERRERAQEDEDQQGPREELER